MPDLIMNRRRFLAGSKALLATSAYAALPFGAAQAAALQNKGMMIAGSYAPGLEAVAQAFADNFLMRDELGACVAVYKDGVPVVDLWGGYIDLARTVPWMRDTLNTTKSSVKALMAFCIHMLADRGIVDMDAPVAQYWPEFAQAGKADITVLQLVTHHAGLLYLDSLPRPTAEDLENSPFTDTEGVARIKQALEKQAPALEPGTKGAYHSSTIIPLYSIFFKLVTGEAIGDFFRREVAEKLDIDVAININAEEAERTSPYHVDPSHPTFQAILDTSTNLGRAWRHIFPAGTKMPALVPNEVGAPATSARGYARFSAMLAAGGKLDGVEIMSADYAKTLGDIQWEELEGGLTGRHFKMTRGGFWASTKAAYLGGRPSTFGGAGAGGQVFLADPDLNLGFGYLCNNGPADSSLGPRSASLIDATLASL